MSYEAERNLDNRSRKTEITETATKLLDRHETVSNRLAEVSIKPMDLVNPDDPNDIYSESRVQSDLREVANIKAKQEQSDRELQTSLGLSQLESLKIAEIAEYDILRGINLGGWIPAGRALKTSEYDDIKNGVDMVVEIGNQASAIGHLGLAVDVSFSHNLQAKFARIKHEIDSFDGKKNRLGRVKYFLSQKAGMRGELSGIARVVAAVDLGVIEDLRVQKEQLQGHIGQAILITEMEHQLKTFHEYALDVNPACATQLERSLNMIRAINQMTEATKRLQESEYEKNRKADEAIEAGLNLFV